MYPDLLPTFLPSLVVSHPELSATFFRYGEGRIGSPSIVDSGRENLTDSSAVEIDRYRLSLSCVSSSRRRSLGLESPNCVKLYKGFISTCG